MGKRDHSWALKLSWFAVAVMVFLAVFAEFVANDAPILARTVEGKWMSWIWMTDSQAADSEFLWSVQPLIGYDASDLDLGNANYRPPLSEGNNGMHLLGTDLIGRDIAAGLIYGCRLSLLTAFLATLIALLIGLPFGMVCGYLGDWSWRVRGTQLAIGSLGVILLWFSLQYAETLAPIVQLGIWGIYLSLLYLSFRMPSGGSEIIIPVDTLFTRLVELMVSLPGLVVLLAVSAAFESKSLVLTAVIIGLLRWVRIGQVARNESIRLRQETFVQSARALGMTRGRIIFRHLLPNLWAPVFVIAVFSIAGFILLESSLSFLGIGVALEQQTWGSMLAESRKFIKAWWLAIFPGLAIFIAIISINRIGQSLGK